MIILGKQPLLRQACLGVVTDICQVNKDECVDRKVGTRIFVASRKLRRSGVMRIIIGKKERERKVASRKLRRSGVMRIIIEKV